jgi:radical SAM family uncharacterized protein
MRDLREQISRELLPRVRRPGQYIGCEINARCGDVRAADVSVCMAFPDTYAIGISHLGSQVLYHLLNAVPGVACDRTYCPLPDAEATMRRRGVPLFGWESRAAVGDFDIVGFSLGYELCVTNVLTMLDLAGVPLHAAERGPGDPIVVGGDALADTPEPMAEFFDVFLIGDGEVHLPLLVALVGRAKREGASRQDVLLEAARTIPGAYVPQFYHVGSNGRCPAPAEAGVASLIEHVHMRDFTQSPAILAPLVPLAEAVHDRVVIEIMRGCPNACRFCQAGAIRLPVRIRGVEEILAIARAAIAATGYREIALLSLSTSDYPRLGELIDALSAEFSPRHVSISLPSLRVDSQLEHLPRLTSEVRKGGLTIAAEAGSERLRRALRKRITEEAMVRGVRAAFAAGWRSVKVYFMAGLPGETEADLDAMFQLCRRLSDTRREVDGHRGAISGSVSWFVPKPHTPMQWCAMRRAEELLEIRYRLRDLAKRSPVMFKFHRVERSVLEAVIARGGREVGRVIEEAWRAGCRLDSWDEHWDWNKWVAAFEKTGVDPAAIAHRELPPDEPLPWGHVACPLSEKLLRSQYRRMREVLTTEARTSRREDGEERQQ